MELKWKLYNPTITKIEVLKLEKRLDDNLAYLRDAPPEYCTFPFDMEPVKLPPGAGVPLNTIQVDRFYNYVYLLKMIFLVYLGTNYKYSLAI